MAWIQKPKPTYNKAKTERVQEFQSIYQTSKWKRLKAAKRLNNPICEICEAKGITSPTEDIHHKIPFSLGETPSEVQSLAYDYRNLLSVCRVCHTKIHQNLRNQKGLLESSQLT